MRNAFAAELVALASEDERIILLSGDAGNYLFNDYKTLFPQRFFNCGAAEANMTSMAAGMALCGLRPITYTITPFATTRCLEQIKIDIAYQDVPVIIVGAGSGLSYAGLGATHHSMEDIVCLRTLPNMTVVCPGDAWEARLALRAAVEHDGPVFIRLGKHGEPVVHEQAPEFVIGEGIVVLVGCDVCLLSTGNMLPVAMQAADRLDGEGISAQVVSFHTVKPLDQDLLSGVFSRFPVVVTVEEHGLLGGFGSGVAEWLGDRSSPKARLLRVGAEDRFLHGAGGQDHARQHFGLTSEAIVERTLQALKDESC